MIASGPPNSHQIKHLVFLGLLQSEHRKNDHSLIVTPPPKIQDAKFTGNALENKILDTSWPFPLRSHLLAFYGFLIISKLDYNVLSVSHLLWGPCTLSANEREVTSRWVLGNLTWVFKFTSGADQREISLLLTVNMPLMPKTISWHVQSMLYSPVFCTDTHILTTKNL